MNHTDNLKNNLFSKNNLSLEIKYTKKKRKRSVEIKEKNIYKRIRYTKKINLNLENIKCFKLTNNNESIKECSLFKTPIELREILYLELLSIFIVTPKNAIALISFALSCKIAFNEVGQFIKKMLNSKNCNEAECGINTYGPLLEKEKIYLERSLAFNTLSIFEIFYDKENITDYKKAYHYGLNIFSFILLLPLKANRKKSKLISHSFKFSKRV